jgi:Rps23 Pro-64 3,4-dihydroxylase Tpa1-like proline 4-hydroxylase
MQNDGEISVTLLLNGGHSRTLYLKRSDPLFTALLAAMSEKGQNPGRPSRLFNLRVDEGRHSLIVASSDLVALLTDPPLVNEEEARRVATQAALRPISDGTIAKSPYFLLDNFMDPALHRELLGFVAAREKEFMPSTVSTEDTDYRRSLVLHEFPKFADYFRNRVRALVPRLSEGLGLGELPIGDIECQLTASNDGDFFRLHNDSGSPDTLSRQLTYVYYFNKEPRAFSGGEFRLYNSRLMNGRYECGEKAIDIEPKNNSILFFPSFCHHEVLPIGCPSKSFIDSRFTINGWVRRAAKAQQAA